MKAKLIFTLALSAFGLTGCTGLAESFIDHKADFPATHVVKDFKKTSDEYDDVKQQERVDELSSDYDAFLESQESDAGEGTQEQRSVIMKKDDS